MDRLRVRTAAAVFSLSILTGCASLEDSARPVEVEQPPSSVPPIVSDRFLLESSEQRMVGELQLIETRHEDTFVDIARAYNLGFDELVDANPSVDPWLPGAGTQVLLPTRFVLPDAPHEGVVINLASKRLFYYLEPDADGARAVVTFPIGIGQMGTATPEGTTTVTSKGKDPVWFPPASIRREYAAEGNPLPAEVMPGPDNPLGSYVLILGMPSYLVHGTNRPAGVGMRVSHGCVRLFPENIQFLYQAVPVNTMVTIVNQPWLFVWEDQNLYLEAHQPLSDDDRNWHEMLPAMLQSRLADAPNGAGMVLPERLDQVIADAQGIPVALLPGTMGAEQMIAAAPIVNNLALLPEVAPEVLAYEVAQE